MKTASNLTTPRFGDLVVKFDNTKHADFANRRSMMQAALKEAGVEGAVASAKDYHGHGQFDLVPVSTKFNKMAKDALKALKESGLISKIFASK